MSLMNKERERQHRTGDTRIGLDDLPRVQDDVRVKNAREKLHDVDARVLAVDDEIGTRDQTLAAMRARLKDVERRAWSGDIPESEAEGLRIEIEKLANLDLDAKRRALIEARKLAEERVSAVEDIVRSELTPIYTQAYRGLVVTIDRNVGV